LISQSRGLGDVYKRQRMGRAVEREVCGGPGTSEGGCVKFF
jgi:hypothetical protein